MSLPRTSGLADPRHYRKVPRVAGAGYYPELFEVPRLGRAVVLYSISFDMRELFDVPAGGLARDRCRRIIR